MIAAPPLLSSCAAATLGGMATAHHAPDEILKAAEPPLVFCPLGFERRACMRFGKLPVITTGPGPHAIARAFAERERWPVREPRLVILLGLALALDVLGAASGLGAAGQWSRMGAGVGFASAAAGTFGLALVLTQHEAADLDGRVRTFTTMATAGMVALVSIGLQSGFHLPQASAGWWGLATLTTLYGTAFTLMFTVLPRLGVVGNSAIMNVEPVFALVLAWLVLGQTIAPIQVLGALIVVSAVMALGLRKR